MGHFVASPVLAPRCFAHGGASAAGVARGPQRNAPASAGAFRCRIAGPALTCPHAKAEGTRASPEGRRDVLPSPLWGGRTRAKPEPGGGAGANVSDAGADTPAPGLLRKQPALRCA